MKRKDDGNGFDAPSNNNEDRHWLTTARSEAESESPYRGGGQSVVSVLG